MADTEVSSASAGVAGAVMHGCHALGTHGCCMLGMHGHMKVDDRGRGQMSGCGSHVEWVTDAGEGLSGHRNTREWGSLDVSSMKCNSGHPAASLRDSSISSMTYQI